MLAKIFVAVALLTTSGLAVASDASYDQAQIRKGAANSVEGGLRTAGHGELQHAQHCGCSQRQS